MHSILGVTPENFDGTYQALLDRVHPDDRALVDELISTAVQDRRPFAFDHRIVRPDGAERILHARGEAVLDETGRAVTVAGTGQDVTELRRAGGGLRQAHHELGRRGGGGGPQGGRGEGGAPGKKSPTAEDEKRGGGA